MNSKELFKSLDGYEYFKSQLDYVPEDQRDFYATLFMNLIVNGFLF